MSDHGHHHDQGWRGALRYVRHGRRMWSTPVNGAVINMVDPRAGEHVVDIGAGMGPATVLAAKRGATVTAVDPTPFMRTVLGARRLAQRSRANIEVSDGAAESLPVPPESIDAAWSVNAMHHWTDPAAATTEIHRVLRPGGRLVLVDEDFDDPRHDLYEQMRDRHRHHHDSHDHDSHDHDHDHSHDDHEMHMVDIDAMAEHLRDAGFAGITTQTADVGNQPCLVVQAQKPAS